MEAITTWFLSMTTLTLMVKTSLSVSTSLTFDLPDNERMCFFEDFHGSARHVFEYSVLSGGRNDVDASLESPNGKIMYKETRQKEDIIAFDTSPGSYQFCFSNEFSTFTHKIVYFSISPEKKKRLSSEGDGLEKPTVHTQAEQSLEAIHTAAMKTVSYQTEYRLNEARSRHAAEQLNKRVLWWARVETIVIFVTGLGQVFVLRAFFTDKKTSSKLKTPQPLANQEEM